MQWQALPGPADSFSFAGSVWPGGTSELIAAILAAPTIGSWPLRPQDSLASGADVVNPVPEGSGG